MITRRAVASSLVALALFLSPAAAAETNLRGAQPAEEQPKEQPQAPLQALPNAYDSLTPGARVEQFQPHFLPIDDSKLLPRGRLL